MQLYIIKVFEYDLWTCFVLPEILLILLVIGETTCSATESGSV